MTDTDDQETIWSWLELCYGTAAGWLTLFSIERPGGQQRVDWIEAGDWDEASDLADRRAQTADIWFGVGLRRERLTSGRGRAADVTTIPGLWVDVDVAGPGHKTDQPLPPDIDAARELVASFPLAPSAIVNTGGGLHAWWLFPQPVAVDRLDGLLNRWGTMWHDLADQHGWTVDSVFDLARVMRLPGTQNRKIEPARPVTLEHVDQGSRYKLEYLDATVIGATTGPVPALWGDEKPGDRYNREHAGGELLEADGWTLHHTTNGEKHYTRPGPDPKSQTGATAYPDGHVAIWTSHFAPALPATSYSPFGLYTQMRHGGDHRAAARELGRTYNTMHTVTDDDHDETPRRYDLTDLGNARRLVDQHGTDLRYIPELGAWYRWEGTRWREDITGEVHRRAKQTVEAIFTEAVTIRDDTGRKRLVKHYFASQSAPRLAAMVNVASTEPGIPLRIEQLDCNPWALNVANGIVDLRTSELHPHDRTAHHTKLAPVTYDPAATCPVFDRFLLQIFDGDLELIAFVQRLAGYSLTGIIREQLLPFLHGSGSNGKSTLLKALLGIMGDYAAPAPPELLVAKHGTEHPTGLADLIGRRLVVALEVDEGRRLAEALVKQLTGGDAIKARRMRQDFFEFTPTHKIWLAANHKPQVRGTDHAMWRRIKLIPFTVTIADEDQDHELDDKLAAERPGILNWALRGTSDWLANGIGTHSKVAAATAEYRTAEDVLGTFIEERCDTSTPTEFASATELYDAYKEWCQDTGERALTQRALAPRWRDHGLETFKGPRGRSFWLGIRVTARDEGSRGQTPDQDLSADATLRDPSDPNTHSARASTVIRNLGGKGREGSRTDSEQISLPDQNEEDL